LLPVINYLLSVALEGQRALWVYNKTYLIKEIKMLSVLARLVLAVIVGIVVAFVFWFVGFLMITFLAVSSGIVLLAQVIQNVGYFAGVIAAIWFFITGYTRFPGIVK
jgi:hypothetical protein